MARHRTSLDVDQSTLDLLDKEAKRYGLSRSDVMRLKLNATLTLAQVPSQVGI